MGPLLVSSLCRALISYRVPHCTWESSIAHYSGTLTALCNSYPKSTPLKEVRRSIARVQSHPPNPWSLLLSHIHSQTHPQARTPTHPSTHPPTQRERERERANSNQPPNFHCNSRQLIWCAGGWHTRYKGTFQWLFPIARRLLCLLCWIDCQQAVLTQLLNCGYCNVSILH